ncbi:hypothetical protein E5170_21165 [Pseudomonas atacamensis]|uniref:Uncharacterized protein n=1 Tax=Pseudomonas atacamensis TaxID=2565368 RepID=A0AAQ2HZ28_9PSED|nr:hypothetical protein E5170_21165 [Pseudomonas atacamensis]
MSLRAIPCVLRGIRIWLKRALVLATFGPAMLWGGGCISVSAGVAAGGFALTASHLFQTPKR